MTANNIGELIPGAIKRRIKRKTELAGDSLENMYNDMLHCVKMHYDNNGIINKLTVKEQLNGIHETAQLFANNYQQKNSGNKRELNQELLINFRNKYENIKRMEEGKSPEIGPYSKGPDNYNSKDLAWGIINP